MSPKLREKTSILVLAALGVVFGDIGTSPLYALKVCFSGHTAIEPSPANVLGLVSLIFWSLTLVVSLKYALFILRADDQGQGGVFAMLALLHKGLGANLGRGMVLAGLFGSALLYGDGLITPVISVLSALEGLEVATTRAKPLILPVTCAVLIFVVLGPKTWHRPDRQIFRSGHDSLVCRPRRARPPVDPAAPRDPGRGQIPAMAINFFQNNGLQGFLLLGAVVLCITGCEALYADMGHFGAKSIRLSWYFVALPALFLNYFGQGALILSDPKTAADSFYRPGSPQPPLSHGSPSHDGHHHRLPGHHFRGLFVDQAGHAIGLPARACSIVHTSEMAEGQVYLPGVNLMMLVAAIILALLLQGLRKSGRRLRHGGHGRHAHHFGGLLFHHHDGSGAGV